jgi:hypothetical protein
MPIDPVGSDDDTAVTTPVGSVSPGSPPWAVEPDGAEPPVAPDVGAGGPEIESSVVDVVVDTVESTPPTVVVTGAVTPDSEPRVELNVPPTTGRLETAVSTACVTGASVVASGNDDTALTVESTVVVTG